MELFWTIRFIVFWTIWILLADKSRWREMLPVCIFAALLGSLTDVLIHYFPLWNYANTLWAEWSDDLSVYPVVVYLFIQWLPRTRKYWVWISYWCLWTTSAILIEWYHVKAGYMSYPTGQWNLLFSYIADWLLFWGFYRFHSIVARHGY